MARLRRRRSVHSSGRRTNRSVGIRLHVHPVRKHHDEHADQAHVVGQRHPRQRDVLSREARRPAWRRGCSPGCCACVSTTPLGSLVEPEENWMKAVSSGLTAAGRPGRATSSSVSIRNVRDLSRSKAVCFASAAGELACSFAGSCGRCRGTASRACPAIRSSFQRCSSLMPTASGTGTMPPASAAQKPSMKASLLLRKQDQLVAAASRRAAAGEAGCRAPAGAASDS